MSDEEQKQKSNVFSLTGDRYERTAEDAAAKPCLETVECISDILQHALANQIRGVYVLGWSPQHQRFVRWCMMPSEENTEVAALRFIGGLEIAKSDMIAIMSGNVIEIDDDGNPTG